MSANGACPVDGNDRQMFSDDDGYFTIMEVSAAGYVACALPVGGVREVSEIAAGKSMSDRLLRAESN